MASKTLLIFCALSIVISLGTALKCYSCGGSPTSDCAKGRTSSMVIQSCNRNATYFTTSYPIPGAFDNDYEVIDETDDDCPKLQTVCLRLTIADYQPKMIARSCGIFPARADPCTFLRKHVRSIQGCRSCKTDLCNNQTSEEYDPVVNMIF